MEVKKIDQKEVASRANISTSKSVATLASKINELVDEINKLKLELLSKEKSE